ncbi:hypothetical protein SDC9_95891 [bioreactor metagenome]|uniref:Uncharacterized protein n=1 Tax=bioreactor metagenome TaxID=1076179 RepID=A0A645AEA0_9ZZZZ
MSARRTTVPDYPVAQRRSGSGRNEQEGRRSHAEVHEPEDVLGPVPGQRRAVQHNVAGDGADRVAGGAMGSLHGGRVAPGPHRLDLAGPRGNRPARHQRLGLAVPGQEEVSCRTA